ncbi:MAG: LamG domain-containing protein [Candidatus Omnitrophica bacterium]|nr:LamG domain-containing protein [Candidatus Omnitrophota bacterium]
MKKIILGCLYLIILGSSSAQAATLVGYWPFEESSGTTVNDQSGFNNDGQLTGATRSSGKVGGALFFNGIGGVTIPNSPSLDSLSGGFTMEAWINQTSFIDYQTIFWKTDRHNRIHMLHFQVGDGAPANIAGLYGAMNHEVSSGGFEGVAPSTIDLDEWHFVAWTYDESITRFYDNGVEVFSASFSEPWAGNDIDLLIGFHPEISSANFIGRIDEARIYLGALTQDEIIRDMNTAIPEPSTFFLFGLGLLGLIKRSRSQVLCKRTS